MLTKKKNKTNANKNKKSAFEAKENIKQNILKDMHTMPQNNNNIIEMICMCC